MALNIKTLETFKMECVKNIRRLREQIDATEDPELRRIFEDQIQYRRGEAYGIEQTISALKCLIGEEILPEESISEESISVDIHKEESPIDRVEYYMARGYSRESALDLAIEDCSLGIGY